MEVADRQTILAKGVMLGCYRIDSFLGQGGFGVTYLARDTMLDLQVAIKEYLPEKIAERTAGNMVQPTGEDHLAVFGRGLKNFLKEARTLARFKHPNIVRVMSVFELNGTAYMVMEYERGHELRLLFHRRQQVTEAQLRAIVGPVIDGLDEVHRHGFIHRDIKPANILVRENGSPVLLDFGSARLAVGRETASMTAMVTVGFAPLEQYSGLDEQQGPWTDIYALGAVLYYAITGNAPVDSALRAASLVNDKSDPLIPLSHVEPRGYSLAFCQAVDWALQFKVSDRPQTLTQWRAKLFSDINAGGTAAGGAAAVDLAVDGAASGDLAVDGAASGDLAADAPTILSDASIRRQSQTSDHNLRLNLENAQTVLMEDQWDISDINQGQHLPPRGRTIFRGRTVFSATFVLGALLLLVIFKPWNLLQGETSSIESRSIETPTAESVLDSLVPAASGTADESNTISTERETREPVAALEDSSASTGSVPVEPSGDLRDNIVPSTDTSTQDSQAGISANGASSDADRFSDTSSAEDQEAARRLAQLENDRAVQRAEMRRMAQMQAILDEQARLMQKQEESKQPGTEKPPISNADMSLVLTRFNALSRAIENRDSDALRRITLPSERNYAYFDYAFQTFDNIEVRISNISASRQDQKIQATLVVNRMIRSNGDIAIPPEEFETIPIFSVKETQWSAIHW